MLFEGTQLVPKSLPESHNMFEFMSHLHPSYALNQVSTVPLSMLLMQHLLSEKLSEIDCQYRKIFLVNWNDEMIFNDEMPKEAVAFWSGVLELRIR